VHPMSIATPTEKSSRSWRLEPRAATGSAKSATFPAARTNMQLFQLFYIRPGACDSCGPEGKERLCLAIRSSAVRMTS
jgi:hypothetical protein